MASKLRHSQDYIYCTHCEDYVSESTFRRHRNLNSQNCGSILFRGREDLSMSSESDSDNCQGSSCFDTSETDFDPINIVSERANNVETEQEKQSDEFSFDGSSNNDDDDGDEASGDNDGENEDTEDEVWTDIGSDLFDQDILSAPPLPDPEAKRAKLHFIHSLLQWFLYFLLVWQSICHISDNGLAWLLRFLLQFFKALNLHIPDDILVELIAIFPSSLYMIRQHLNLDRDDFTKYTVCPKCTKCYEYGECLININGEIIAKRCSNKLYSRGKAYVCNNQLVKKVTLKDNTAKFYPLYYYCYSSIINALEKLLQKKGFPERCEEWRSNQEDGQSVLTDVYDGKLWKDFAKINLKDFLDAPRNYGLMLNFDFFQPMKHRKDYSVGVLYLVILNLPRRERFKWENVIVVGIIPSMDCEPKTLNEFLKPAVTELKALWKGLRLTSSVSSIPLVFRAALLCTSSDIPASRKLCGLKGHSGELGCSKCMKKFPGSFGEKRDYSGFDRDSWVPRTNTVHRRRANKLKNCKTKAEITRLSKKYGIIFHSALLDLEYFDVIRFCTIDPMHNLFLGTAKYVFKMWISDGHISKPQLKQIEKRLGEMDVPPDMGRLPMKIASNYGSYTAEQWKNWTLVYSLYALKNIIEDSHLKCWQTYVLACKYICKPVLQQADVIKADGLLLKFCKEFQHLYGNKSITPNMHLHCHLKEVILDYGPIHTFWCFSFERYNGIMGSVLTNNRSIELQLMRKLTLSRHLGSISLPEECNAFFSDIVSSLQNSANQEETVSFFNSLEYFLMDDKFPLSMIDWNNLCAVALPTRYKESSLKDADIVYLYQAYKVMFPDAAISCDNLSKTVKKYGIVNIFQQRFGSNMEHRNKRSAGIIASWPAADGSINKDTMKQEFGLVDYYFSHSIVVSGKYQKHIFACVTWYVGVNDTPFAELNPLCVVSKTHLFPRGASQFLPVQRISTKCAFSVTNQERRHCVVSPLLRHFCC